MDQEKLNSLLSIEGLQFVPIREGKFPKDIVGWQTTRTTYSYDGAKAVGLVCGPISGNVEAIDIDAAHDAQGTILQDYKSLILEWDPGLLRKLVVQKSPSGGYHFFYRCAVVEGNKKLANEKKTPDGKSLSLIETRGTGGQILVDPSPGYQVVQGGFAAIPEISVEERQILFQCAMTLNRNIEEVKPVPKVAKTLAANPGDLTPGDDYNARGDWKRLLESHGWKHVATRKNKIHFLRPGDSTSRWSGDFHVEKNVFSVFSTSTVFEPQKGYSPFAMYAQLVCKGDFSEAAKALSEEGYGKKAQSGPLPLLGGQPISPSPLLSPPSLVLPPSLSLEAQPEQIEILVDRSEIEAYLESVANGTLKMGKKLGMPGLDEYWVLKENYFVMVNGFDNVGKSTFMWWVAMASAVFYDWKWAFLCMENMAGPVVRKLCEFYWGRPLSGGYMNEKMRKEALDFVMEHFHFLTIKKGWTYMEVLEGFSALKAKHGVNSGLIDPYRSLVVPSGKAYEYHSKAGNDIKRFAQGEMSVYVNIHANSSAARNYNKDTNSQKPPTKADVEYGGAWTGPVDDFLTVHRNLGDAATKYDTQVFVRKIKERETGGDWTNDENPIVLRMPGGITYTSPEGFNPIAEWREKGFRPGPVIVGDAPKRPLSPINLPAERLVNSFESQREQEEEPEFEPAPF